MVVNAPLGGVVTVVCASMVRCTNDGECTTEWCCNYVVCAPMVVNAPLSGVITMLYVHQ